MHALGHIGLARPFAQLGEVCLAAEADDHQVELRQRGERTDRGLERAGASVDAALVKQHAPVFGDPEATRLGFRERGDVSQHGHPIESVALPQQGRARLVRGDHRVGAARDQPLGQPRAASGEALERARVASRLAVELVCVVDDPRPPAPGRSQRRRPGWMLWQ